MADEPATLMRNLIGPSITVLLTVAGAYGVTQYQRGIQEAALSAFDSRINSLEAFAIRTDTTRYTASEGKAHSELPWHSAAGERITTLEALLHRVETRLDRVERDHEIFKRRTNNGNGRRDLLVE